MPDRTRLLDLTIPGTHDTATGYYPQTLGGNVGGTITSAVMCQDSQATYEAQLNNGIRYFDLRFRKSGNTPDSYKLYHTYDLNTNLSAALGAVQKFLTANPSESVFVSLQPDDNSIVTPSDMKRIFDSFKYNSSLPSSSQVSAATGITPTSETKNLWIEGYKDFDTIRQLRPVKGLGNLGPDFNLTDGTYNPSIAIQDPRGKTNGAHNPKLNYGGLALGDVRGKIIFVESWFKGYSGNGWDSPTGVDPLDVQGIYSSGMDEQNNYGGPTYEQKKSDITNFSLKAKDKMKMPLNFTSASSTGINTSKYPPNFALTINSGLANEGYKTDGTDTLASLFNRGTGTASPGGRYTLHNITGKITGLNDTIKGIYLGDYYTTNQQWYNEFWNGWSYSRGGAIPNPNNPAHYPASDWLTQKIWRQSAIMTPSISVSNLKDTTKVEKDPATGLPVLKDDGSQTLYLKWNNYLGANAATSTWATPQISDGGKTYNLNYKITKVDPLSLGLATKPSRTRGLNANTKFSEVKSDLSKNDFEISTIGSSSTMTFAPGGASVFKATGLSSSDGDRFFRLDLVYQAGNGLWKETALAPTYFMVKD